MESTIIKNKYQSFKKIRRRKRKLTKNDISNLIQKRKNLKTEKESHYVEKEIEELELIIAAKIEEKRYDNIKQNIDETKDKEGNIDSTKLRKSINKLCPKNKEQKPLALKDDSDKLTTNYEDFKNS